MAQRRGERGVTMLLIAIVMVAIFGFASFAVDIGSALVTKAELQNVSDAGSLAGARELAMVYKDLGTGTSYKDHTLTSTEKSRIEAKISTYAGYNSAGGVPISVLSSDMVFGIWDKDSGEVEAAERGVKAVSLKSRRDGDANGVVQTSLARVLGIDSLNVAATAGAGLTPLGGVPAGTGEIPVGISSHWFEAKSCENDNDIKFYPTGDQDGCAGWHTFTDWPASSSRLKTILNGLEDHSYTSPATTAGETYYNFTGGVVATRFNDMKALYDSRKDGSGDWHVTIPVYQDSSCGNPNGSTLIIGFARARVYAVNTAPDMEILAQVECGIFDSGTGNGPNDYGTLYGIPGMVQ